MSLGPLTWQRFGRNSRAEATATRDIPLLGSSGDGVWQVTRLPVHAADSVRGLGNVVILFAAWGRPDRPGHIGCLIDFSLDDTRCAPFGFSTCNSGPSVSDPGPAREKLPDLRHTGMPGLMQPEGVHFLQAPARAACVDSHPNKHRPHLAGNADRCIRGWNGEKYRPGRKGGDEIMLFLLILFGNPHGLSTKGAVIARLMPIPSSTRRFILSLRPLLGRFRARGTPGLPHSCACHRNPAAQVLGR